MEKINPTVFQEFRSYLLTNFPCDEQSGIRYRQVEQYIESLGMKVKPHIVLDQDRVGLLKEHPLTNKLLATFIRPNIQGVYSPELDLVLIKRHRLLESYNGPLITESLLVHELAHANLLFRHRIENFYSKNNSGLEFEREFVFPWGWFFEEGWAELHRAGYIERHADEEYANELIGTYSREQSASDSQSWDAKFSPALPPNYYYIRDNNEIGFPISAFAGYGLEIMCRNNSALYRAFRHARHSYSGLPVFIRLVDTMCPGLFKYLQKTNYSEQDFRVKLVKIQRIFT